MEKFASSREIYIKEKRRFAVESWKEGELYWVYVIELAEEQSRGVFRRSESKEDAAEEAVEVLYKYNH
ncbi:hypothetical protein [Alkalicoccus halolimnae]|uniref:Uncharacterized protein n=1 Tax=Alkalicoccus halolimnae TaxID=1667239 RepID=A0A5C7F809_9BACI|nr:hypothetical protein [Alkalicoccus halolimnae]TXF85710.1 hypothetical protein FTX54_06430 [Alkalicoccus halolimnae]